MVELNAQDSRLQFIQPAVIGDFSMLIFDGSPVVAQPPQPCGQCLVRSQNGASIPASTQVLCREKTQAREPTETPRLPAPIFAADSLRHILDQRDSVCLCQID